MLFFDENPNDLLRMWVSRKRFESPLTPFAGPGNAGTRGSREGIVGKTQTSPAFVIRDDIKE
ncbi:MAG: hypothetical protein D6795_19710 [Deltaproteobacteria bacterium]|nr:MAG: hypothetical protein D6795_19710 [Deltaproteobacteria bacterium]